MHNCVSELPQSAGPHNTLSPTWENIARHQRRLQIFFLPCEWGTEKWLGERKKEISQKYTANTMTILRSSPLVLFNYQTHYCSL